MKILLQINGLHKSYGARVILEGSAGRRSLPVAELITGMYETAIAADEIIVAIEVPFPAQDARVAYVKFQILERPSVGAAVFLALDGERKSTAEARIAVGCAGPRPKRVGEAEAVIKGKSLDESSKLIAQAGQIAARASEAMSDLHGAADYKEHLVGVLLKRAFHNAAQECLSGQKGQGQRHG